jgi:hypothetical protein
MSTLTIESARKLVTYNKTTPILPPITPRWLSKFLSWENVTSGIYRVNKVTSANKVKTNPELEERIEKDNNDIARKPLKYILKPIKTNLKIPCEMLDLFNEPFDQREEQIKLAVQNLMEERENMLFNDEEVGLLNVVNPKYTIKTTTQPTPYSMDDLLGRVWQKPCFFVAHPLAIVAFSKQCTKARINLDTIIIDGCSFLLWRGLPIVPSEKIPIKTTAVNNVAIKKTSILLIRVGRKDQGVVGLMNKKLLSKYGNGLSVRFKGIDNNSAAGYLITLYYSISVLSDDALGVLECVV